MSKIDFGATFMHVAYQAVLMVMFASVYATIGLSRHFTVAGKTSDGPFAAAYFSVITQVTLGYGDIFPVTDFARMLVMAQSMLAWLPFLIK